MELTPQQELFVAAFCGEAKFSARKAAGLAGYSNPDNVCSKIMRSVNVKKAIREVLKERAKNFYIDENVVLNQLWKEATKEGKGSQQSARITALVWLGKHLGMWQERVQKDKPQTVNIKTLNYSQGEVKEKIKENEVEVEKKKEELDNKLPFDIQLQDYTTLN